MASYPSTPVTFPARADGQTIFAQHIQLLQDEIAAIEAGLLGGMAHTLWATQALTLSGYVVPPQITADQNDYAPAGLSTAFCLRLSSDAARQITGLLAQSSGRILCLTNVGTFTITIPHNNSGSVATNRVYCPGGQSVALTTHSSCWIWYDSTQSVWRVIATALTPSVASGPTYIGTRAYTTTTQAITLNTWTSITFQAVSFDYGTCWAVGTPTRLTVPAGQGGVYLVLSKTPLSLAANTKSRFMKNGAVCSAEIRNGGTPGSNIDMALLNLAAGDYLETQFYTGASGNVGGSALDSICEFSWFKQNPS